MKAPILESMTHQRVLASADAMEALGADLAAAIKGGAVVYLTGELGAGKTTLVRGLLRALGHGATVKSPTYTLVEPYTLAGRYIYHFDLYRLGSPCELEAIGARDYFQPDALCLIEWPERARDYLPGADIEIVLSHDPAGRKARLSGFGVTGAQAVAQLNAEGPA